MQPTGQQATDTEVEMVTTMLRIAADIDRLDELSDQQPLPSSALRATPALLRTAEGLRARAEQVADLTRCPVLRRLVEEGHQRRQQK
ncbi:MULTISPECIES: hypothetical protein [unclassified Streptomyces]|uniref:hypothetical protein n=1 Tax=unclassified Streptomyces TaxID=2593676 RepID=UPI00379C2E7D